MDKKEEAVQLFKNVLKMVNPLHLIPEIIKWDAAQKELAIYDKRFRLNKGQSIYLIGAGKASHTMAEAVSRLIGGDIEAGCIIAPPGTSAEIPGNIHKYEGSHPLPDSASLDASAALLRFIKEIPDGSVVINLFSGGASSLFCMPAKGLNISDIKITYQLLIECGASIQEINTVRATLSDVKGGKLLRFLKNQILLDLIISDVPDDDKRFIGSGPTTAQEISDKKSAGILKKYKLWEKLPENVRLHINSNLKNKVKAVHTPDFDTHYSWIISSSSILAKEAAQQLKRKGYSVSVHPEAWSGPIEKLEERILEKSNRFVEMNNGYSAAIFRGECTVKVTGGGLGGRNQELALRIACGLKNADKEIVFLSAGTDGIDGPTDAAGAVVDNKTYSEAVNSEITPEHFLKNNDSYRFFEQAGGHIKTGPSGNNLMDLQILLAHA